MKQLLCCFILMIFYTACQYPYNTPQARRARQEAKEQRREQRKNPVPIISQQDSSKKDSSQTTRIVGKDSTVLPNNGSGRTGLRPQPDSTNNVANTQPDSLRTDSIPPKIVNIAPTPKVLFFSKDSLPNPVQYGAKDSMIYDLVEKKVYLYGNAEVVFEQYSLKAGFIIFDFNTNIATAEGIKDSSGMLVERPFFSDGNQTFDARKIQYNFKSKKGKVFDASTQQGDGYFIAKATKFIAKDAPDAINTKDDVIYSGGGIYTTCNHLEPHFGIRVAKAKVIPNKLIVAGPAYLEIMGTPTPLALPFGFFPLNTPQRKSGLILSTDMEFSPTLGPGIKNMGYYWSIGQHFDLAMTADVYFRGSFRVRASSNYAQRYKARGSVEIGYSRLKIDEKGNPDYSLAQDFNLRWNHTQDPKAHPSQSFQASINFGTSSYFANTSNNANQVLQNNLASNISYTKRFVGTPVSLTLSLNHSQNLKTRAMSISFPRLDVRMNRITPFKRKKPVGQERWYERIGFSYNFSANNTLNTTDTAFFNAFRYGNIQENIVDKMEYSIRHTPSIDFTFKLFKYINVAPSFSYSETWYFYRNEKTFDPTLIINADTIYDENDSTLITAINRDTTFGQVVNAPRSDTYGFYPVRDMSAGVNLNTQIFAIGRFRIGKLPAGESHKIRLTLRPNIGFRWRPDYSKKFWGYYDSVQTDVRYPYELRGYNRFPSVPSAGKSALLDYSLTAVLDGKFWRKPKNSSDTSKTGGYQKSVLLNNISIGGNYNVLADSLHWSPLSLRANTVLFKYLNLTFSSTFDMYAANPEDNERIQKFQWQVKRGELMRWTSIQFAANMGFGMKELREIFTPKKAKTQQESGNQPDKNPDLFQNFRIGYNLTLSRRYINGVDSIVTTANTLSLAGNINLSKGWNITISSVGYDFSKKRITYPDFSFSRNLHCWEMGVQWQPERRTWSFFLRVRPGSLGFINIPVRKNFYDPF